MVGSGSSTATAVRSLASKSNVVPAPILLGSATNSSSPCLTGLFSLCFLLFFTVWVTPENRLAKLALRGSSVLPQDFRGPQTCPDLRQAGTAQFLCINRLSRKRITDLVEHQRSGNQEDHS